MKTSAKTSAKAAVKTVKVSAALIEKIKSTITSIITAAKAVTKSEQSMLILGKEIANAKFPSREIALASLKPYFIQGFKAEGKDEKYAGEQASRAVTLAFLGTKVTSAQAPRVRQNLELAEKAGLNTNTLLDIARGSRRYDAKTKQVVTTKTTKRAHNASDPKAVLLTQLQDTVTRWKTAKLGADILLTQFVEHCLAQKLFASAELLRDAIKD